MSQATQHLDAHFESYVADLETLIRIPSVSFDGFPPEEVSRSAAAVAALLKERGLQNVEILTLPGAHPYVYAERLKAPGKPTLLLYAHHDVQPPGRMERWESPPFTPTRRKGPGGERLYARGSADDKAGVIVHAAAIDSILKTAGELPVNVKLVIEGEEEIGSGNLPAFLKAHRKKLDADVLVLTDTTNQDMGWPALTVALRGLVAVDVEVRALTKTVHSGMWGGPLPDPVVALSKMLATLLDTEGKIAVPGALDTFEAPTPAELEELKSFPYNEAEFREQSGLLPGAKLLTQGPSPAVQVWRYPSLTVTAIQASSRAQAANIVNDTAWAKVTIRLAQGMDPEQVTQALIAHLKKQVPWGLDAQFTIEAQGAPWSTPGKGPAFDAAEKALEEGYGKKPLKIGCGGSIPFVAPFAEALGGVPSILIGVEDPHTNAHGENESLLLSDLKKACLSQILFFERMGRT